MFPHAPHKPPYQLLSGRRLLVAALSAALALVTVSSTYAAIPDPTGLITGCYSTQGSTDRVFFLLDSATSSTCPANRASISWYQLPAPGAAGNVVQSDGTRYISAPLSSGAIPPGSPFYIQNTTTQQPLSNFNVSGSGTLGSDLTVAGNQTVGGTLSVAGTVNTNALYTIGGSVVLNQLLASSNLLLGNGAGLSLTTGSGNTAAGIRALTSDTSGYDNTATGIDALASNTTGAFNTANGRGALFLNTTGSGNTALGLSAGRALTTGNFNTASGVQALYFNTTGNENTVSGYNALLNTSSDDNTAFGFQSLFSNSTGTNNTALGNSTGITNDTGSHDLFLGALSDAVSGNLSNATAIGFGAKVGESNAIVLGGSGVNVGIGTNTPHSRLQLSGSASYLQFAVISSSPPAADCATSADNGRAIFSTSGTLYICNGGAWTAH